MNPSCPPAAFNGPAETCSWPDVHAAVCAVVGDVAAGELAVGTLCDELVEVTGVLDAACGAEVAAAFDDDGWAADPPLVPPHPAAAASPASAMAVRSPMERCPRTPLTCETSWAPIVCVISAFLPDSGVQRQCVTCSLRNFAATLDSVDAFEALADPTRRRIVELLVAGEQPAGHLAAEFHVSRPAISRHLRVLREAGLVTVRGAAQQRLYALEPSRFVEVERWLAGVRAGIGGFWAQRLDALETQLRRQQRAAEVSRAQDRSDHHGATDRRRDGSDSA